MHSSKTLLNAAIVILALYGISYACECRTMSTEESFRQADAVFVGKVVSIEPFGPWQKVTFDVNWQSKGDSSSDVSLYQASSPIDFQFDTDRTYFVFANKSDGRLFASRCSGTRVYSRCGNGGVTARVFRVADVSMGHREYSYTEMALITGISVSLSMSLGFILGRLRRRLNGTAKANSVDTGVQ
ncbi:MAG: hypothetical protein C5B55_11120 [Blastocatellia bacterium]|nr:MAG: hypothetical protein C5B55_11120 [Blastocatellia bacterium]